MSKFARVPIVINDKEYFFFYSMGAAQTVAKTFGTAIKAQAKLNEVMFKIDDGKIVPKSEIELATPEFFDTVGVYFDALLMTCYEEGAKKIKFHNLDLDELGKIVSAIFAAIGYGNPGKKEDSEKEVTSDPPKP